MSRSWAGGSTRQWRRVRSLTYANQGRTCALGLEGCTSWADQVHHVEGKRRGDHGRTVPACGPCNRKVGDPTVVDDPRPRPVTQW